MADSAIGFDRGVDTAGYSPHVAGARAAGERSVRMPQTDDAADAPQHDLASLIRLGSARLEAGADTEATECFRKALELGDRMLGPDNPDLILLLNDLTRLYLKQSAYADAEPLLLRLLDIKRTKGEDHPEVATVLASLANVHQALGRHESAEQLWRRVLEIREATLAPNHFAIATALERLADACAARGNIREALPAFQRALTIRERTLGSAHPSLRISRERIGDLQLQSAEESLEPSAGTAVVAAPEKYRLISGDQMRLTMPAMISREVMAPMAPVSRKPRVTIQHPAPAPSAPEVQSIADEPVAAPAMTADTASYRNLLETMRDELEDAQETAPLNSRLGAILEAVTSFLGKRQVVAGIVVIVTSLVLLALAKDHAWGEPDQTAAASTIAPRDLPSAPLPATSASALSIPVRESASIQAVNNAAARTAAAKPHVEEHTPARRVDEQPKSDSRKISLPTVSKSLMSNLDALASKAATSSAGDQLSLQPSPISLGSNQRSSFEADQSNGPVRARLIGELPTPKVPAQVADVEGDVRVRFSVDAQGMPVMSTFSVVTSPNPLLTAAVKKVIPSMRFEPARTGGQDPKAIADVVETGFRFARGPR